MGALDCIKIGHDNAIQRPSNEFKDRSFRRAIENANNNGDCIINVGNGYYRPSPADPIDNLELDKYFAEELKRARAIQHKRLSMKMAYERWRECGILTNDSRSAR